LVILAALLILTSPVGHAYAYAPLQTGSGETTPGSATAPASTTPGETLADQVPDWAVIPIFVVALLTLTYIFEDELIGWLLANVLKGCSSLRIWLESIACAAMAAQSAPKLEWLQYTYNRLDKWAQLINNYIAQYETALGSFSSDLNDFTLDLADYAGLVSDVSNNFQIAGDDPRAANMPGGAGGIYQALQAWYTALQLQSDSLNQQLTDLTSEYNSDLYYSQTIQDEDADYDTQKAAFIAELQAFLKTLVCITCTSVQALLNQAQQLQEPRVVNSPSAAPAGPIPPVQPAPPPVPQPPGGGGGGGGQNLQTQEKKTCRVKLEDKVIKTDFMIQLEMDEFSLYDHPDTGEIKESKHYGKDYLIGDAEANRAFIVVSAYGLGNEEHDVKISTDDGTQVGQVTLNSTPGGYDFVWKLESARVTDPRYDPADTDYDQPKFQLEGLDRLRSASTKGSIVILPIEVENLYREWEVQGDVLYFDGKLLDFELDLTCTATARPGPRAVAANVTQSASGTDTQALPSKTKKFTITATGIKAGDKGDQTDDYQISLNQDTTADTTAGFGTGIEDVSMAFGTGGTLFASGWTAAAPSCQFPANAVTMMAGDYTYLQWSATQKVEFDLTAQYGGCAPDTLHFQETTVLQGENHAEVSEDSFDWAIKSDSGDVDEDEWGTLGVVDDGTVLVAPDVDKDEDFTMTFTVQDVATEEVVMTKTFRITVNPYKNVMDWLDEDKLHEKLVSSGAIQSGDGASLKLYHPMEPDLWELVDVGLYGIGMSIKLKRKYDRYEKMLKALTKEPLYPTFELSNTMPPEFAGVPRPEFSRLHPLKRVTEPLVLGCTLADLWFESTGPDYFYRGGTSATLQEAWTFYTSNVFKPGPNSPWQFTNEEQLLRYSSRVRRNRLMTSCSVRFNDLSRVKMAYEKATATVDSKIGGWESYPSDIIEQAHSQVEALVKKGVELPGGSEQTAVNQIARQLWIDAESQNIYKPKAPIVGEPKHVVRPYKLYPDPNQPAPLPVAGQPPPEVPQPTQRHELRWEWSEKTKIGTVEKFSMTHDVDAYKLDSGEFRVTKVNDVINVVKEVSPFQRRAINEYLAYLQEQVGHGVTSYGSGTPATAEEFITQMLANVEKAKTAPVQLKTPQPAPEPKMETTFGRSIRLDSFKNWSMNMISEAFQSAKQGAAWGGGDVRAHEGVRRHEERDEAWRGRRGAAVLRMGRPCGRSGGGGERAADQHRAEVRGVRHRRRASGADWPGREAGRLFRREARRCGRRYGREAAHREGDVAVDRGYGQAGVRRIQGLRVGGETSHPRRRPALAHRRRHRHPHQGRRPGLRDTHLAERDRASVEEQAVLGHATADRPGNPGDM
jgi:hypothetical protein